MINFIYEFTAITISSATCALLVLLMFGTLTKFKEDFRKYLKILLCAWGILAILIWSIDLVRYPSNILIFILVFVIAEVTLLVQMAVRYAFSKDVRS